MPHSIVCRENKWSERKQLLARNLASNALDRHSIEGVHVRLGYTHYPNAGPAGCHRSHIHHRPHYSVLAGVGGALFFWAVGYTSGSIELNRSTNTATITGRMTAFLPAQHRTVSLQSVAEATLDQKPNSRRIRLEVDQGQDLAFPIWSDRPGQQEAVDAINQFLQKGK